jgi:hypothetical protein
LSQALADFIPQEQLPPLLADGRDIVVLKATIVDKKNHIVPHADNLIHFILEGEGTIIGVGNGDIASHEPNKADCRKAYNGACVVIVKSTPVAGELVIRAESEALLSAQIMLQSQPPAAAWIAMNPAPFNIAENGGASEISVDIVDKFGGPIPSIKTALDLRISGPAFFEDGLKSKKQEVIEGKCVVRVKSSGRPGTAIIEAFAPDDVSGKTTIKINKIKLD